MNAFLPVKQVLSSMCAHMCPHIIYNKPWCYSLAEEMCPLVGNTMGQLATKMGIVKGISVQSYIEKVGLDDLKGVFQPS